MAQSAIYACGHIRRTRGTAIANLRASGYTTAILFNVNVEADGSLTTDFSWDSQTAAEAGGIICQNGEYVFAKYQPYYVQDVKQLLTAPTSINRIEICIGGWGNGSYGKIRDLIKKYGTGEETMLYKNFKALKEAIPEIVAVNNDQEQDYDLETATAFHRMLAEIGYKTTVAPYMNKQYWKSLVANLNETPGTCEIIYLQTYGGGAGNNPSDWKVFGDVPMYIGFDCEASGDRGAMETRFTNWRNNSGVVGGFLWNYNSEARNVNEWATAINRIFKVKTCEDPVATFYQDINYGGYSVGLPEGEFHTADLALYGIQKSDVTSIKVKDGYKVTLYASDRFSGTPLVVTEDVAYLDKWNDKAVAVKIEALENSIDGVTADADVMKVEYLPGSDTIHVAGILGKTVAAYNASGLKVSELKADSNGEASLDMAGMAKGLYIVKSGAEAKKVMVN